MICQAPVRLPIQVVAYSGGIARCIRNPLVLVISVPISITILYYSNFIVDFHLQVMPRPIQAVDHSVLRFFIYIILPLYT